MKTFLTAAIAAVTAACASAPAFALVPAAADSCTLRIDGPAASWIIQGFDPLGNNVPAAQFDVTFRNEGTAECRFAPILSLANEVFGLSDGSNARIPYNFLDRFGTYDMTPISGQTPVSLTRRQVVIGAGQQQTISFLFSIDADQLRRDGMFTQNAELEAVQPDGLILTGQPVQLGINVLPSARIGLSGAFTISGGRAIVDLGELAEGPVQVPLHLRVQSTRRYRLSFQSLHDGNLQLSDSDWRIPYAVSLDGHAILLAGGAGQYVDAGGASYREDSLPLGFVIGDTSSRRAGTYSDVLTISVEPQ